MRDQQPQLAIALAQEYLRRFPDEPDAVPQRPGCRAPDGPAGPRRGGAPAAGRPGARFPGHPLRSELIAALETLEDVARRGR